MMNVCAHRITVIGRWPVPLMLLLAVGAQAAPLDPPSRQALDEAQRIVQEMKSNPRGPYSRIAWFCNDGSVHPPVAYACRERGGGRQHAEYSAARERLAVLGWSVGTVYAALDLDAVLNDPPRRTRLRQLPLERYLVDIDGGWVLQRAQGYRGRVQVEDELARGRSLLDRLLADDGWVRENYLLMRELARVVPHGEDSDIARRVRRLAIELAELDPAAEPWRAEIHASPDASTTARLRTWLARQQNPAVQELGQRIVDDLEQLYGAVGRRQRTLNLLAAFGGDASADAWQAAVIDALAQPPAARVVALCSALGSARDHQLIATHASERLQLVDAVQGLETEAQLAFAERHRERGWTRAELLAMSRAQLDCAYSAGLLSVGERRYVAAALDAANGDMLAFADYHAAVERLKRVPAWAAGTVRHAFAEALVSWAALDSRAARFSDDLLRGSPVWMLGATLKLLAADADRLSGQRIDIAGEALPSAVALNGGLGRGILRIYPTLDAAMRADMTTADIVVLPETIAELEPVAGILTLGEGSPVSHVQLLARNFGIPNVAIAPDALELLEPLAGREVLLAVSSEGNVVLRAVDEDVVAALGAPRSNVTGLTVPVPDLSQTEVLHLADIGRELSGRVVGPKAANLGELNRLFPGRVAPALAIPFGIYAAHLAEAGLDARIRSAFAAQAAGTASREATLAELASVRAAMTGLRLSDDARAALVDAMQREFGNSEAIGVFVRSDTNVEDLPEFTGAGLNETVPNVVGLEAQLEQVPRVWASVLSPRALAWRSAALTNPEQIYASVLLMQSVPADKSGVLVTTNLVRRAAPGMTVSTAWGVGGAVAGEAAETLVIHAAGAELVTEAKAPYRRRLVETGGVDWAGAPSGPVLTPDEIDQLRALAAEVNVKYETVMDAQGLARPWDIEFGFVAGRLTLFQIRPLVERGSGSADAVVGRLLGESEAGAAPATVRLDEALAGGAP